jgi:hypothetical protein
LAGGGLAPRKFTIPCQALIAWSPQVSSVHA